MNKRRYCHLCGRLVRSYRRYTRGKDDKHDLVVCSQCEVTQPRCSHCGMPAAALSIREGLCPACWNATPSCLACGLPVGGSLIRVGDEGPYCENCFRTRPRCDVCGVPVGVPNWSLADGRQICHRCHSTAIYQPERARELFEQVTAITARDLGLSLNVPTEFMLVDRNQLLTMLQDAEGNERPDPAKTLGVFRRQGRRRGMYVGYGLPQILIIQIMAHEYAHAWQGENCPLLHDALLREGFAEWVAYKVLQALGASKKMAVMEGRQDQYGSGLRHMLAVEQARGIAGVLDYCRDVK